MTTYAAERYYEELGAEVGESAFHIKGSAYIFHDKWVEEHLPGGREAQRAALGAVGEHEFFDQIFVASAMYDVYPLVALGHACASLRDESLEKFVTMRSAFQATQDLRYIRKWLVKLASPTAVAKRLPSILTSYFDFGTPETETSDGGLTGYVRRVPKDLGSWLAASCRGFGEHALTVNGAQNIGFESEVIATGETEHATPMADVRLRFRWSQ